MTAEQVVDGVAGVIGWVFRHEWTLLPVMVALVLLLVAGRVAYNVADALATLRLKRRGGDALAAWLASPDTLARGPGQRHSGFYAWYLQSPQWAARSQRTITLAGGACQHHGPRCAGRATQAHHLDYARLGHEADADLLAVCKRCHDALHGR